MLKLREPSALSERALEALYYHKAPEIQAEVLEEVRRRDQLHSEEVWAAVVEVPDT